jgi:hypothetical protein
MANAEAPILARLLRLERAVREFLAEPEGRILCFQLADDEERLFEGFVRLREEEEPGEGYVLLSCDEPFASKSTHGITLVQGLLKAEQERAQALAEDDVYDVPWMPPRAPPRIERRRGEPPPDQVYLVNALSSLKDHHCAPGQRLFLCLLPQEISDIEPYARWLSELGFLLADGDVRVCVTCELTRTWGHALARAHPVRVRLERANLDMPRALEEISRAADDAEDPSGRFRHAFVRAHNAIRSGDAAELNRSCELSLSIARAEGWAHLEFAAQQLLGAGALGFGDLRAAFAAFENAERATHHDIRFGATWMSPLLLQARLSKGSVAVTGGVWQLGARVFAEEALPVARALGDKKSEIECLRLAGYCEERNGNAPRARVHLVSALAVAETLSPAERRQTTLAFVGEALLRMTRGLAQRSERMAYDRKLTQLLGKDWESLTERTSATPEDAEASVDDWLRTASPSVPIQGPTGTHVIAKTQSIQRTATAAVDAEAALAELMANQDGTIDADAFIEVVSRTWDTRGDAPEEWPNQAPEVGTGTLSTKEERGGSVE